MKILIRSGNVQTVIFCAFSVGIEYVRIFKEILDLDGHQNCTTNSRVPEFFLYERILLIYGIASGLV